MEKLTDEADAAHGGTQLRKLLVASIRDDAKCGSNGVDGDGCDAGVALDGDGVAGGHSLGEAKAREVVGLGGGGEGSKNGEAHFDELCVMWFCKLGKLVMLKM